MGEMYETDVMKRYGRECRQARCNAGLTVAEAAVLFDVSERQIYTFERGETNNLYLFVNYMNKFNMYRRDDNETN